MIFRGSNYKIFGVTVNKNKDNITFTKFKVKEIGKSSKTPTYITLSTKGDIGLIDRMYVTILRINGVAVDTQKSKKIVTVLVDVAPLDK